MLTTLAHLCARGAGSVHRVRAFPHADYTSPPLCSWGWVCSQGTSLPSCRPHYCPVGLGLFTGYALSLMPTTLAHLCAPGAGSVHRVRAFPHADYTSSDYTSSPLCLWGTGYEPSLMPTTLAHLCALHGAGPVCRVPIRYGPSLKTRLAYADYTSPPLCSWGWVCSQGTSLPSC